MHGRQNLGIVVQHLTDRPISGTIVTDDLGQPVIPGLKTQHGFLLSTHPCSPMWSLNNHEDKDASFLYKPDRGKPARKLPQQKLIMNNAVPKLLTIRSPLKVMIYRTNNKIASCREGEFAKLRGEIENTLAAYPRDAADKEPARWLFVAIPYYWESRPTCGSEAHVQLYTLTTPGESLSLVEPAWDLWGPAHDMDDWFRSLPLYSSTAAS